MTAQSANETSAYNVSDRPGGVDMEIERLRNQALIAWEREARTLQWFGLRDGMSVLDVGAGPGFVSAQLLDMLPNGSVTALEVDPVMIERAESYLADRKGDRLKIVQASLMSSGLPEASYDFAYARYVFQHLPDPVAAAAEIKRLLKPGGKLVILDIDDRMHLFDPEDPPEVRAINERFLEEHRQHGGNRAIGRALLRVLREAGYKDVTLELVNIHSDEYGLDQMIPVTGANELEQMVTDGLITEEERVILAAQEALSRAPSSITMFVIFLGCGTA